MSAPLGTERPSKSALGERQGEVVLVGRSDAPGVSRLSATDIEIERASGPHLVSVAFKEASMKAQTVPGDGIEYSFYRDLLFELGEHARRGGTAYGAAAVAKRVPMTFGVKGAERLPLPRATKAEREAAADRNYRG